ncbi:MAG: DUF2703 domain-containing protein [Haloechinothrix sp.]
MGIDFLFLDLTTCTRCLGADRCIESALAVVGEVLEATGVEVEVKKVLVESAEQFRQYEAFGGTGDRLQASPFHR